MRILYQAAQTNKLFFLVLQEIVDKDGNSKLLSFTIPSLSKPSIYHEVGRLRALSAILTHSLLSSRYGLLFLPLLLPPHLILFFASYEEWQRDLLGRWHLHCAQGCDPFSLTSSPGLIHLCVKVLKCLLRLQGFLAVQQLFQSLYVCSTISYPCNVSEISCSYFELLLFICAG